jgi:UDP-N-acetylmuramate--alanine ligase
MGLQERLTSPPAWIDLGTPNPEQTGAALRGRIHLVGIGGIGMSGIAEVLLTLGYRISGSDLHEGDSTHRLAGLGAEITFGHSADAIDPTIDVVVVSSAVDDANPEVRAARKLRIPVIQRAEMLAELMRVKCGVAVAGAHGKTTTTSLVAAVMGEGGFDPTVVIGGRLKSLGGTNARLGRSRYMVAEADESDGSFLLLRPTVAVVTNVDREHMDYYGTMEALEDAYVSFINSIPFYGRAVLCTDGEEVTALLGRLKKRFTTYGTGPTADFRAVDVDYQELTSSFEVVHRDVALGRVRVAMPGEHMVRNALAAIAVGMQFGIDFAHAAAALAAFDGIMRRFEVKGEKAGVLVVDDYGHHPTEIRATLAAARHGFDRRIVAVFQPHRYTRTHDLFQEFTGAFADADAVFVTDIYAAGETPMEGVDAESLAVALSRRHRGSVTYVPAGAGLADRVAATARPGDLVLTLGAGDITRLGPEILARLAR